MRTRLCCTLLLPSFGVLACHLDAEGAFTLAGDATVQDGSVEAPSAAAHDALLDTEPADVPDATDGGDDARDAALNADACKAETDRAFCLRLHVECGPFTGLDNCGGTRSVDCGGCSLPSTCGGAGTANVCDWWWSCEWRRRQRLTVSSQQDLPNGYSVSFEFDHRSLVNAGLSAVSGSDVRIVQVQAPRVVELDRVLDPDSQWNSATTRLWFATKGAIPAGGRSDYYLFVGNLAAGSPPADEASVFHFADFFDRADSDDPGPGWLTWESGTSATVGIANGSLRLLSSNENNRPVADHLFVPLSSGLELRFGAAWRRTATESLYRLHLQLGKSAAMDNPPPESNVFSNRGAGPSLLWSGPEDDMIVHEGFGYEVAEKVTQSAVISGKASVAVRAWIPSRTFDLFVDGTQVADDVAFSSSQVSLDRLRFFAWKVSSQDVPRTALDWVVLRPLAGTEPTVAAAPVEQGACP